MTTEASKRNMSAEFLARLRAEPDDDRRWELLVELVTTQPDAALAAGLQGLASADAAERELGADLLGQVVGIRRGSAGPIADALVPRLRDEQDAAALESAIVALGHAQDQRAVPGILDHATHPDAEIRFAVAFALGLLDPDAFALASLRRLSEDSVDVVREWATFALGQSGAMDRATIEALAARSDDLHADTRAEAIYGLALRGDPRARGLIEREAAAPGHGSLIDEARDELDAFERRNPPPADAVM